MSVRVRFAPSPTGLLHIGGVRSALYNQLFALHNNGVFALRIEDTDRARFVEGGIENILRTLQAYNIIPTEGPYLAEDGSVQERGDFGPYIQSKRHDIHMAHAKILLDSGKAYRCFCTPERLEEIKAQQTAMKQPLLYDGHCRALSADEVAQKLSAGTPHVIRIRMPQNETVTFTDGVRGELSFESSLFEDMVLVKSDGFAAFPLANVVDDHLMHITHVIRAEEWLPSTPKHILIHRAFGWTEPVFAHLPQMLNPDRTKLSKRQGDVAAEEFITKGYLPEALVNFLALQGWNPSGDREVYTKDELIKEFDLNKVNKAGAVFDRAKLDWMNKEYLKKLSAEELFTRALPFLLQANVINRVSGDETFTIISGRAVPQSYIIKAVSLEQARITTLAELVPALNYLFNDDYELNPTILVWKKSTAEIAKERLAAIASFFASLDTTVFADKSILEETVINHIKASGWTNGECLWPLRVALTGQEASPGPCEVAWVLGKDETLRRINHALLNL